MSSPLWTDMFPALSICRLDLVNAGCNREQIAALTDEQMQHIAEAIGNYIEDYSFDEGEWEKTVRYIVGRLIANITITPIPNPQPIIIRSTDDRTGGQHEASET